MPIKWSTEDEFWKVAAQSAPLWFRILRRSLTFEHIEAEVRQSPEWLALKEKLQAGDLIWPFEFNRRSLACRKGFVIIRNGKPLGGVITIVS